MKILGTGLSGLIGSRIVELLTPQGYQFEDLSKETGVDITDHRIISQRLECSDAPWVFHLAAVTDVQGAENERLLGQSGLAWRVNVAATENIATVCRMTGKRILYISTDYVFDGTKEMYTEVDRPNPKGWYAVTKYEGEKIISEISPAGLIVRIANPYRAHPVGKKDFVHKMIERLAASQGIVAPTDQLFVPTFIDDIAEAILELVSRGASGICHVVGDTAISPYEAACMVARTYGFAVSAVSKTTFAQFSRGRAPLPQYAVLRNDKIKGMGIVMRNFSQGITEVKRQEMKAGQ